MKIRTIITAFAALLFTATQAQIPAGYYDGLRGKKGAALKNAIHEIIKEAKVLSYGSGTDHTWEGFYYTDNDGGNVVDRYSNDVRQFGRKGEAVVGMNIEHSFPKSWWGGTQNQAYKDLYNLMPCEQRINSSKSNYPMGKVETVKTDNDCTRIGTGSQGYMLWEPADKWKGDFARGYMYMATAYQDFSWSGNEAKEILQNGDYPTLKQWAYTLYIQWARADRVDEQETDRNEAVSRIQENRNPYVDFPNLMEYVWGDSVDYAFDPDHTAHSTGYTSTGGDDEPVSPPAGEEQMIYTAKYTETGGDCTAQTDGSLTVWQRDSKYGWKGTGYISGQRHDCEATLSLPAIDLSDYASATLTFKHAVNFCSDPSAALAVEVECGGQTTVLTGITWPRGDDWTFTESGDIDITPFAGRTITIRFHYRGTTSECATWEISRATVSGITGSTGIGRTIFSTDAPRQKYDLSGRPATGQHGIIIVRQGGKSWKIKN